MNETRLTWPQRGELWLRLGIRLVLTAAVVWLLWRFGSRALSLFAPFILALVTAAVLNPVVQWAQRRTGWSRGVLAMILLLALLALIGGGLVWLGMGLTREIVSLVENWDGVVETLVAAMGELDAALWRLAAQLPVELPVPEEGLLDWLVEQLSAALPQLNNIAAIAREKAASVSFFAVALVFYGMGTYFLMADWPGLRERAVDRMSAGVHRFCSQVRTTALAAFGGYLRAQVLLSFGVCLILVIGFLITGQSYALLLALALAVLDFIPIVGAGTVMVPWAVIALITGNYPVAIRTMVIWGVIVLFRRGMEPKIVGDQTGLSPILSLVSIYVGMRVAGVLGMVFAPILLLVCLNLGRMGLFDGVRGDLIRAVQDVTAILSQSRERQ